jgi:hypothetical protein
MGKRKFDIASVLALEIEWLTEQLAKEQGAIAGGTPQLSLNLHWESKNLPN